MEFVVKGETREGRIMILKRGFASQDKAEDHPIRMSDWKRVWVEQVADDIDVSCNVRRRRA
jgi:hypothetical protein